MSWTRGRAAARGLVAVALLVLGGGRSPALRAGADWAATAWQRSVIPAGTGPQQLPVDALLRMASADGSLRDLRLVNGQGREVPYLLVPPPATERTWRRGRLLPIAATKDQSGFELDLGRPVITSRLRLERLPEPFLKRYRLEGSGDRQRWTVLVAEGTLFALPEEGLRQLEASFPGGEYRYLRVTWYDRQSQRLPLPGAAAVDLPPVGATLPSPLVEVAFSRRSSEPRVSRYRLRLPGRLPVRALVLEVGGGHLLRRAQVLEAHLRDRALEPAPLGEAELRRTVRSDGVAEALRIPLAPPEEQELELQVEDGDNPPLELRGVRAELPPQPWIYFESPDGAPLVARCGDSLLQAPRYDLEAVRDRLTTLRPRVARWAGPPPPPSALLPDRPGDPGPGGPVDAGGFRQRRPVPIAEPGLAALLLDAQALAGSSLSDLRLANPAGQQIPYLLERRDEPLAVELAAPGALLRDQVSTYLVALPAQGLPASRLVLETSARVFERRVQVFEESGRAERGDAPVEHRLAEATWRHTDPEAAAAALALPLPALRDRRILVRVDEGDNRPLPITAVRLLLPSWRLRFFHPGTPLTLLYGHADLAAPRYDLALLAPRLRAEPAREIALGSARPEPEAAPAATLNRIFWIALVGAVVVLLALLARLLGRSGGPPA